jgi:predicted RNase H-like nuclease (RuvC/YqgF family)
MLNAIKMVKDNVKGMPVQVSESKILAVNVDQRTQSANVLDMNMDQLNRNIKKLESKLEKMEDQHRGDAEPVIDVESEESTIDPSKY